MPITSYGARLQSLLAIHRAILAGTFPNASTLAKRLEVSTKTVQKYIQELRGLNISGPVYDSARHGYHYPSPVSADLMPRLNDDEVLAYFLLAESSRSFVGTPVQQFLDAALEKFSTLLPVGNGLTLGELSAALSVRLERAPAHAPLAGILVQFYKAILNRRQMTILYPSQTNKRAEPRTINPLHLTRCDGQWYVVAYCTTRQDFRIFVPSRMQEVETVKSRFEAPVNFNPAAYFKNAFGIMVGTNAIDVNLVFEPNVAHLIKERMWHPTQKLEVLKHGSVRLTMSCVESRELLAWLLSWGASVHVESPPSLRTQLTDVLRRALSRYA